MSLYHAVGGMWGVGHRATVWMTGRKRSKQAFQLKRREETAVVDQLQPHNLHRQIGSLDVDQLHWHEGGLDLERLPPHRILLMCLCVLCKACVDLHTLELFKQLVYKTKKTKAQYSVFYTWWSKNCSSHGFALCLIATFPILYVPPNRQRWNYNQYFKHKKVFWTLLEYAEYHQNIVLVKIPQNIENFFCFNIAHP